MHARTMPRLAGADPSSIAFDHGQLGRAGGADRQGLVRLGVGVAALGQFGADVVHHPLDRLGGDPLIADLLHDDRRPLERAPSTAATAIRWTSSGVSSRTSKPSA